MSEIIKTTNRKIVSIASYNGTCHKCNTPANYTGEIIAVQIEEKKDSWVIVPIDIYKCPECGSIFEAMRIYKSLEVSEELAEP